MNSFAARELFNMTNPKQYDAVGIMPASFFKIHKWQGVLTMKKIILLPVVGIMLFCNHAARAATETIGSYTFTYSLVNGEAVLNSVSPSPTGALIIPDTLGGYAVTSIRNQAFYNCTALTSVTMPDGLISIGDRVFWFCINLSSVTIPSSVTFIGYGVFYDTTLWNNQPNGIVYLDGWALGFKGGIPSGKIVLKNGTRGIATYAFLRREDLTGVTIPASVQHVGDGVFATCKNLREVYFGGSAPSVIDSASLYSGTPEDLTTYVYCGSKGWDGNPNSTALPAMWCGRPIAHVEGFTFCEVPVPHWWLDDMFPNDGRYEYLVGSNGENNIPVWQSWVAGLDPNDKGSCFTARINMDNGNPVIEWVPDHRNSSDPRMRRNYTVLGKANLTTPGDWVRTNEFSRFFKVKVELPELELYPDI